MFSRPNHFDMRDLPSLPVEASDWQSRVVLAGGSVGNSLLPTGRFIARAKELGIWSSLTHCNLLAGGDLTAALTPLIGNAPTNTGFVAGDYSETVGLTNGTTKQLRTGVFPVALSGMSVYSINWPTNLNQALLGCNGAASSPGYIIRSASAAQQVIGCMGGNDLTNYNCLLNTSNVKGLGSVNRFSATNQLVYYRGVTAPLQVINVSSLTTSPRDLWVFGRNNNGALAQSFVGTITGYFLHSSFTPIMVDRLSFCFTEFCNMLGRGY